jgi:hypothetical protein
MASSRWLLPAATGVAGLVAGFLIGGAGEAPATADVSPRLVVLPGADPTPQLPSVEAVTLDDLRRVVREELAALPAGMGARVGGNDTIPVAPTSEQNQAAEQARAVLDAALSRRSWTSTDREALAQQFADMTPGQREAWLQQYAQAVNQGRLVPESEAPPF